MPSFSQLQKIRYAHDVAHICSSISVLFLCWVTCPRRWWACLYLTSTTMMIWVYCTTYINKVGSSCFFCFLFFLKVFHFYFRGARWCSGRASGSESRGPVFNPHWWHRGVVEQDTLTPLSPSLDGGQFLQMAGA